MADRYVRSGGGNWNSAGTWEETPGGGETVAIPTSSDDVYLVSGSGNLTLNASGACRSFDCTGYTGTLTHNNTVVLTIGTSTSKSGLALKFVPDMTYTLGGSSSTITFNSSSEDVLSVDFYEKTLNLVNFAAGSYQLQNDYTQTYALTQTGGSLDINDATITFPNTASFNSTGTTERSIDFGSAQLNFTCSSTRTPWTCSGSGLTILSNTAEVKLEQTANIGTTFAGGGFDYNGLTLNCLESGLSGGNWVLTGNNTFGNLYVYLTTVSKGLSLPAGGTTTITGNLYLYGNNGYILSIYSSSSGSSTSISKSSGNVDLYQCSIKDITFTGGATFTARSNCTNTSNNSGITFSGGSFYLDYASGNDSTSNTPYGWWSVSYTNSSGNMPAQDETVTGQTSGSTAKVSFVHPHEWGILKSGKIYFYGKSDSFEAETISCDGGGSFDISEDFTYCPWSTVTTGASAARISASDIIKIKKSPNPTSTGQNATWCKLSSDAKGILTAEKSINSSTNASPIVITSNGHGYANGDIIRIYGHLVNTRANGIWKIQNVSTNTFELAGSTGNGTGVATGTCFFQTHKSVILTNSVTKVIDNCEENWTAGTNVTSAAVDTTTMKQGGSSLKIVTNASHSVAGIIAKKALASTLDLSAYQQISFWYYTSVLLTSGLVQVKLYSDSGCTVEVESFDVPVNNPVNRWIPVVINKGSALNNTVNGISIYATAAYATKTFAIDNIIACKSSTLDDSITLLSLISKESSVQGGDEPWVAIQSICGDGDIQDKLILLDQYASSIVTSAKYDVNRGYGGVSENVPLYKRDSILTTLVSTAAAPIFTVNESGAEDAYIQYQGGYNIEDNTQDGESFFCASNGLGYGLYLNNKNYIKVSRLNFSRCDYGIVIAGTSSYSLFENLTSLSNNTAGISIGPNSSYNEFNEIGSLVNGQYGFNVNGTYNTISLIKNISSNSIYGLYLLGENNTITQINNINNNTRAIFADEASYNKISLISNMKENPTAIYLQQSHCNIFEEIQEISYTYYYNCLYYSHQNLFKRIVLVDSCGYAASTVHHPFMFDNSNENIFLLIDAIQNCLGQRQFNFLYSNRNRFEEITVCNNSTNYAFYFDNSSSGNYINKANISGFTTAAIYNMFGSINYFHNTTIDGTEFVGPHENRKYANGMVCFQNLDDTENNHWIFTESGTISSDISNRHTESGICWKLSPTGSIRDSYYPLVLKIAKIACNSGSLVTIKAWMKRSSTTDIQGTFLVRSAQLDGVGQIYADGSTGSTTLVGLPFGGTDDTNYHEGTITFTPTETGVIEVECWAWWLAGSADESVYIDDMTITQA